MQDCPQCGSSRTNSKRVSEPDSGQDRGSYDECADCKHKFNVNVDVDPDE